MNGEWVGGSIPDVVEGGAKPGGDQGIQAVRLASRTASRLPNPECSTGTACRAGRAWVQPPPRHHGPPRTQPTRLRHRSRSSYLTSPAASVTTTHRRVNA